MVVGFDEIAVTRLSWSLVFVALPSQITRCSAARPLDLEPR